MAEDWNAIALEVADALRSVGETEAGYQVILRQTVYGVPPNGYTTGVSSYVYFAAFAVQDTRKIRNAEGNLIENPERVVTISSVGIPTPTANDHIALGVALDDAATVTDWLSIKLVLPLDPAGVAVLHDLVLGP